MEEQKRIINEDTSLIKIQGFIRSLTIGETFKGKLTYRFQIRYIDSSDKLVEPDDWYSGFGKSPGVDGDYIIFKYKMKDSYRNIKEVLDVKFTHDEPTETDKEDLKKLTNEPNLVEEEIIIPEKELTSPYYALLLVSTINLCIKKGNLSDEEIKAQYNRFIKLVKSNEC